MGRLSAGARSGALAGVLLAAALAPFAAPAVVHGAGAAMPARVAHLAGTASAHDAPVLRSCVADVAARGCRAVGSGSLAGASALAVSGSRVYVGAYGAGSVLALSRGLSFAGCVAGDGTAGCAPAPDYALGGTGGVAVAGNDVYVASGLGRSLSRLTANPFAFGACDCAMPLLAGASAVAVAPNGRDVYVTSFDAAAVTWLRREADGSLRQAGCIADSGAFGCVEPPGHVLEGAAGVAIAPGGHDVYVTSFQSGAIVRFARKAGGGLVYRGCLADNGANGCRKLKTDALVGATGIAAKGNRLYVAAQTGTVSAYARPLTFLGATRRRSLGGATGIAVHGTDVYVAARQADAITRLRVTPAGTAAAAARRPGRARGASARPPRRAAAKPLRFVACVARKLRGCARGSAAALDGVYGIAVSGRDLYAASPTRASVSRFRVPTRR